MDSLDVEAPTINGQLSDVTVNTGPNSATATVVWVEPTAVDDCGIVTLTSTHTAPYNFTIGTTTVIYNANDASGNIATKSFHVTVTG